MFLSLNDRLSKTSAVIIILLTTNACDQASPKLTPFYPVLTVSEIISGPSNTSLCHAIEPYTAALDFESKFNDKYAARDIIDEAAHASYARNTAIINSYAREITKLVSKIKTGDNKVRMQAGDCLLFSLSRWAEADALTNTATTSSGRAMRKWTLGSITASFNKVIPINASSDTLSRVRSWFHELGDHVIEDYRNRTNRLRNNHDYWAAWAVMNTGIATQDEHHLQWSIHQLRLALGDVDENGYLANELKRKTRAREYHNFAVMPLVAMAANVFHHDRTLLSDREWKALIRLVTRLLNNIHEDRDFADRVGVTQQSYDMKIYGRLAWLPMYLYFGKEIDPASWSEAMQLYTNIPHEPYTRLGGDTTAYLWAI